MRRVWTLVALPAVTLSMGAATARAAHLESPVPRALSARADAVSAITALSLVPGDGNAELVIAVAGPVHVQDFTVPTPHRLVLDVTGAKLGSVARAYDRVARGGITNIRYSQYRANVVRVVLDMDGARKYTVKHEGGEIRVLVAGGESFAAWHSAGTLLGSTAAVPDESEPEPDTEELQAEAPGARKADAPPPDAEALPAEPAKSVRQVAMRVAREVDLPRPVLGSPQSQQARITVTYQDAEIRDVLAAFANFSGRTIIAGKDVTGTVTAEIKDQPWDVALKAILEAQGLAASEEASGIITVDSYRNILDRQSSEPLTTQMVSINYVSATSLVGTVGSLLHKECIVGATGAATGGAAQGGGSGGGCIIRGSVAADSATNTLIVTEVSSRLPDLLRYVAGLDVRTPQVALKAKILSVSRSKIEQLGLSYDLGSSSTFLNTLLPRVPEGSTTPSQFESQVLLGGEALAGVSNASRRYKNGAALNLLFSTALGKFSLTSFLDALQETQLSDIQAEPSIVTLDNRRARILVGQETPVRVIDAGSAGVIGQPVRANVQFRETGIILTVTPHITNNRQIRMTMEAEQSELRIVGGDLGFIIDKRNAQTQLLVNDGETAIIGGLTQTQVTKNRSGIPILSELPLIGRLFSQTETREDKRDLVIMITPTIIDEGEAVRPPEGSRK